MAYAIAAKLMAYEFRGVSTGVSKAGKPFATVRVESQDGTTAELSCSDPQLIPQVQSLVKGSVYNFDVRCVARHDGRSYIVLLDAPVLVVGPTSGVEY